MELQEELDQKRREQALRVIEAYRKEHPAGPRDDIDRELALIKEQHAALKARHSELLRQQSAIVSFDETAMSFVMALFDQVPGADDRFLTRALELHFGGGSPDPDTDLKAKKKATSAKKKPAKPKKRVEVDREKILSLLDHEGVGMTVIREGLGWEGDTQPVRDAMRDLELEKKIKITGIKNKTLYHLV